MAGPQRRPPATASGLDLRRLRALLGVDIATAADMALSAAADAAAAAAAVSAVAASLGSAAGLDYDTDTTFAADSDSLLPTQAAVAAFVVNYVTDQALALFGMTAQEFCAAIGASYTIGRQTTQLTCPANTSANILLAMPLPAMASDAVLEITTEWGTNANTNVKTGRIYHNTTAAIGGTLLGDLTNNSSSGRTISDRRKVWCQGSTSSQRYHPAATSYGANLGSATATATIDVSVPTYLVFTAQKFTDAADTLTLDLALACLI